MNTQSPVLVIIGLFLNAPVDQSLNNGHLGLLELLLGISSSGVGHVDSVSDLDVISEGDVLHLNAVHKLSTIGQ